MKYLILSILILLNFINCNAQSKKLILNYENFEKEILTYKPKQNKVPDKDFKHGLFVLNEVKKDVKNDVLNFNLADYFNILSSFLSLKESKQNIVTAYEKFKNSERSCEYFMSNGLFKSRKFDIIRHDIEKQILQCKASNFEKLIEIDSKTYSSENNLNYKLVNLMTKISQLDKKYRGNEDIDWPKQTEIDLENQRMIDSLYTKHKKYIGTSLVGKKLNYVMWIVIQHSNIEMMEKFLPIIQKAVKENEIGIIPLKMLIDRIYSQKENYQIFGSQAGVKLVNEKNRKKVIEKYNLE